MKFLALLSVFAFAVIAAPIEKREPSVRCGGRIFSSSQVATAVKNADNDAAPSSSYPHTYK